MTVLRSPQFGAILFRASELISSQGSDVFQRLGISLPASRISIVLALHAKGALSSTELSDHIGLSRQLIESRLKPSIKEGFFISLIDSKDSRRRIYDIAESARDEADQIVAIMMDFEKVYATLWQEVGIDLEEALKLMETALNMQSLTDRLFKEFPKYHKSAATN